VILAIGVFAAYIAWIAMICLSVTRLTNSYQSRPRWRVTFCRQRLARTSLPERTTPQITALNKTGSSWQRIFNDPCRI
jgi:hypothetical protein